MNQLFKPITDRVSHLMWALIINGAILVILAVFITWNPFILQLLVGLVVLVVAFSFFYAARKLWVINKILKK